MGSLAGFRYREMVRRLQRLGFCFDRQAAGRHEIWQSRNRTPLPRLSQKERPR